MKINEKLENKDFDALFDAALTSLNKINSRLFSMYKKVKYKAKNLAFLRRIQILELAKSEIEIQFDSLMTTQISDERLLTDEFRILLTFYFSNDATFNDGIQIFTNELINNFCVKYSRLSYLRAQNYYKNLVLDVPYEMISDSSRLLNQVLSSLICCEKIKNLEKI